MKILHIDTRPDWRGGQMQILLTMRGLRAHGHESQLLARGDSPLAERASAEGFLVHANSSHFLRLRAALRLRQILGRQSFDVVHAHDPHALSAAWLARAHHHAALVASRRVALPLSRCPLGLARYRAARRIFAVSQFVAQTVIRSGISPASVAVVYDGVEVPEPSTPVQRRVARERWKVSENEFLLGCVGYFLPGKGQDILLRAFVRVRGTHQKCRLLFVGDGPARATLEALAREMGVGEFVVFAGFVADIDAVYRALDVFVFPAQGEALGTSLLLAMAHGLPVVAAASGGVPEIIEDGKNGILVPGPQVTNLADAVHREMQLSPQESESQVSGYADAMRKLLDHREAAARIAPSARETVERRFSADLLAERTAEEYRKLLSPA
jgi:glycosyltransferase involved in cell wall biosynthesis